MPRTSIEARPSTASASCRGLSVSPVPPSASARRFRFGESTRPAMKAARATPAARCSSPSSSSNTSPASDESTATTGSAAPVSASVMRSAASSSSPSGPVASARKGVRLAQIDASWQLHSWGSTAIKG
jgi:hypothetical protein